MSQEVVTEKSLQIQICRHLSKWFYTEMEVWSECRRKRIDIMIVHKWDTERKYPFGIEVKTFDKKTGADAGRWLFQAQGYSCLSWTGYGRAMIIVAPQFSENVFSEGLLMTKYIQHGSPTSDHNVSTFLGQFNLGELQRYNYEDYKAKTITRKTRIVFNGLVVWDERQDEIRANNYDRLWKR